MLAARIRGNHDLGDWKFGSVFLAARIRGNHDLGDWKFGSVFSLLYRQVPRMSTQMTDSRVREPRGLALVG